MTKRRHDRVKGPILIPFSLMLLLGLGTLFVVAYQYEEHARQHDLTNSVRAVERLFNLQIANDAARLHAALCPISRDDGVSEPFLRGDRASLLTRTEPLFERLRERHRITHFYFLDPARRVVLRVHQPDMVGDTIARTTTLQAEQSGHETQGIELGPLGTLTLRAVKPWYRDGQLVGYLELGEEIDHVSREIHDALGVDLLVLLHRRFLPDGAHLDDTGRPDDPVVVSNTLGEMPAAIAAQLSRVYHAGGKGQHSIHGERALYTAMFPLRDAGGREIGNIVVVRDVTELQTGFHESLATAALLSLLAGAIVFALFYVILDRVERDYLRQRELETQFARLSTEHQRIVQIEKLSEVGRAIGEIAHQINNPLVGVVNMAQLAEREADDPVRVRELLAGIRQAGADCHAFMQRMLAFTRVSRSERKPTDIVMLIRDTIDLFQQSSDRHPLIVTDLPAAPLRLDLDPVLIRHALFNLLANAAQVSPAGGEIGVSLRAALGPARDSGWSLVVADRGPGLSDTVAANLFTPFFTTQPNGTGLGLAVVQHVAVLHDGSASGQNRPGGGAEFAVWLPQDPTKSGKAE